MEAFDDLGCNLQAVCIEAQLRDYPTSKSWKQQGEENPPVREPRDRDYYDWFSVVYL